MNKELKIVDGIMCGLDLSVQYDAEFSKNSGGKKCKHCVDAETKYHKRSDGSVYTEDVWICPRVVTVGTTDGYDSTSICLDCLIENVPDVVASHHQLLTCD